MKSTNLAILLLFAVAGCGTGERANRRADAVRALATTSPPPSTTSSGTRPMPDPSPTAMAPTTPIAAPGLHTATFALG